MVQALRNSQGHAYLTVNYLPQEHVVSNAWTGYQTHSGIIYGTETSLYAVKKHRCPYLLNDNTQVTGSWDYAVEYCVQDWAPRATAAGLSHFAHVISPDAFAARSAHTFLKGVGQYFAVQVFTEAAEALDWLRDCRRAAPPVPPAPAVPSGAEAAPAIPRTGMQRLASYPFLNIYLHTGASRALEAEWLGPVGSGVVRQALTDVLEMAREHKISAWITDLRRLGHMPPDDIQWVATHIMPALVKLGVKRVARLNSEDPLSHMLIKKQVQANLQHMDVEIVVFQDLDAARAWAGG
jgi:hypothetical protein